MWDKGALRTSIQTSTTSLEAAAAALNSHSSIDKGILDRASPSSCQIELSSSACHRLSLNDLLGCSKMSAIKTSKFFFQHGVFSLSQGPPPMPKLDFGLWTLSPHSSAVFPTLSPRSLFLTGQRFPPSRDFR